MVATILPNAKQQFIDGNGVPLAFGTVEMCVPTTTTHKDTWQDAEQSVLNDNPLELDSRGQCQMYGTGAYRQIVRDEDGNLIWDQPVQVSQAIIDVIGTIALLRTNYGSGVILDGGTTVLVQGYYAPGDKGNGSFWYDEADSSSVDNGGTVIVDDEDRRWKRIVPSTGATPCMFGAKGDGSNDTAALLNYQTFVEDGVWINDSNCIYMFTSQLSPKVTLFLGMGSEFLPNLVGHATDCLLLRTKEALSVDQIESRAVYYGLKVNGQNTGLDLVTIEDGSPIFYDLVLTSAYRDSLVAAPSAADGQGVENLTIFNGVIINSGRHALHFHLVGNGAGLVYINESNCYGFEVRSIGRNFSGANMCRFTFDNIAAASQAKIGRVGFYGGNWDADQGHTSGGNSAGDVLYADLTNGSDFWNIEAVIVDVGGIESTTGSTPGTKYVFNTSDTVNATTGLYDHGSWNHSSIRSDLYYNWGVGVPNTMLLPAYGNVIFNTADVPPSQNILPVQADPSDLIGLRPSKFDVTDVSYLSSLFQNGNAEFVARKQLVASSTITIDIPIVDLRAGNGLNNAIQLGMIVTIDHPSFSDDTTNTYGQLGMYFVRCGFRSDMPTVGFATSLLLQNVPGSNVAYGFNPSTGVAFSITSSDGTQLDILRCTLTGGASVGSGGANTSVMLSASRHGLGVYEGNLVNSQPNLTRTDVSTPGRL